MAAGDDGVGAQDGEKELDRRTYEQEDDDVGRCFGGLRFTISLSSTLFISSIELSETKVHEPEIRALLGTFWSQGAPFQS